MPYKTIHAAVESSEYYKEYKNKELERKRLQVLKNKTNYLNNPNFNETITRDVRGFLVSFPNPVDYHKDNSELYELVKIDLERRIFLSKYTKKINNREFEVF